MGKGYNNYMCKKPFHPGSKANIKRTWMAEQRTESEKQKQEELRVQYEKEQELYNNRALLSKESKDKLALNFMYEAPPGAKKERQKEDNEPEYKFEWQRKYNAPREDFAKNNKEIRDQPFGIPVRNVRCIKCHQWGHLNTDKECPLYHQAGSSSSLASTSVDPLELMRQMREEGLALKQSILGHHLDASKNNQHFVASDNEEEDPEMAFLKGLSLKQKKKLLRKLNKLAEGKEKQDRAKKKKKKKAKKSKRGRDDSSGTDSEEGRSGKARHRKRSASTTSSSDSESSSSNNRGRSRHQERHHGAKRKRDSSSSSSSPERRRHKQHHRKHH